MAAQPWQAHIGKIAAFGCGVVLTVGVILFADDFHNDPAADRLADAEASLAVADAFDPPGKIELRLPHAERVAAYANAGDEAKAKGAASIQLMGGHCPLPWRFQLKGLKVGIMTCGNGQRYLLTDNRPERL
jgi:hypothetical protein